MPISSNAFVRATTVLLLVGFLALLGIVGTTIWLVERTQVYFNEVVEAREARSAATDLRSSLLDAETGQRGYLLTGNEVYLEPYAAALERLPEFQERLFSVLVPYPQAQEPLAELNRTIDFKLNELARTIELTRTGQREQALAIVNGNSGNENMQKASEFLRAVIRAADERLGNGVVEQRNA
ncbi:MAG: histidine kinase, partial [Devosia sp.]|nr:histidine kinase [Devosia sp.]